MGENESSYLSHQQEALEPVRKAARHSARCSPFPFPKTFSQTLALEILKMPQNSFYLIVFISSIKLQLNLTQSPLNQHQLLKSGLLDFKPKIQMSRICNS